MTTRQKILERALKLFNESGYVNVGVREISRSLDMSPGNLSYHFPKKDDLLFAIMKSYSKLNDQRFAQYEAQTKDLKSFLAFMETNLTWQFKHRGVILATRMVADRMMESKSEDFAKIHQTRRSSIRSIIIGLQNTDQINLLEDDVDFLVNIFGLIGRFGMQEAFLYQIDRNEKEVVAHYLNLMARQLYNFATPLGKERIRDFYKDSKQPAFLN